MGVTSVASQAAQKKSCHFVCARALNTRCARLSRVKFCAVRIRNAIHVPCNHLNIPLIDEKGDY